ncbi:MAG TPA: hypothetical protein VJ327_01675 [Patescibacteria group bacterium]|nr:hypothetical protein [Patescibacteria group bacterium]
MAVTLQRAWNITTELLDKANDLNRLITRVVEAKIEGEDLTPTQRQNIRNRATTTAQEMQTLLTELLAP